MLKLLLSRLLQAALVTVVISLVAHILLFSLGNPVAFMLGENATWEMRENLAKRLGLDKPWYVQYGQFLWNATHGDFGESYYLKEPAMNLIAQRMVASIMLVASSLGLSLVLGISLGVISAIYHKSWLDRIILMFSVMGVSAPPFWLALIGIYVFAIKLRMLPSSGYGTFQHIILPVTTLAAFQLAVFTRLIRDGMIEVLSTDYVRTAHAKGLAKGSVVFKHGLRNTLIPIVTVAAMRFATLFAFAVVTERIFAWPGSGRLLLVSLERLDYPLIVSYLVVVAGLFLLVNLVSDVLYGVIDPRVRD